MEVLGAFKNFLYSGASIRTREYDF